MIRSQATVGLVLFGIAGAMISTGLVAQISPGPLSSPHADLEGSDRCLKCHSQKKRISAERCLDCHEILRDRIYQQLGFHSTVAEQGCERCHMEHHGVDFELIYWGEEGEAGFDHETTSFGLEGTHATLSCRSCHKESLIRSKERFRSLDKNLDRTFLGLDGSACLSCHEDEHRGQFSDRTCETCHGQVKWAEGNLFEHETARFQLVGKHREVACDRCHIRELQDGSGADDQTYGRYIGLPFSSCTDCHKDPHSGRLGSECSQCHTESGWRSVNMQRFDHNRTRFALQGAHRQAKCESCHPTGVSQPLTRFENCSDCHGDHHLGQFAERPGGAECDACHDVQGFAPARYSLAEHQESRYPLVGAHLAVACDACHVLLEPEQAQKLRNSARVRSRGVSGGPTRLYSYPSTVCSACHKTPHEASLDRFMLEQDCLTCHEPATWRRINFDHERTDYSLVGGHQRAGCRDCHQTGEEAEEVLQLEFEGRAQSCVACHEDRHAGQFDDLDQQTQCTRCHSYEAWKRPRFDHNRDSSFSLDGVHAKVPCNGCHRAEQVEGRSVVRYKPLARECRDCHAGKGSDRTD